MRRIADLKKVTVISIVAVLSLVLLTSAMVPSMVRAQDIQGDQTSQPNDSRPLEDYDTRMAKMEEKITGFGGLFADNEGKLNIYRTAQTMNLDATSVISAILEGEIGKYRAEKGVQVLEGKYTFSELLEYKLQLRSLLSEGLNVTMVDIDDVNNRMTIGVVDAEDIERVQARVSTMDIPTEAVKIIVTGPEQLDSHNSNSPYRPVKGGIQLEGFDPWTTKRTCSMGFIADHPTHGRVGVTAGHCSEPSTDVYQPLWWNYKIGTGISGTDPKIPRYSDSILHSLEVSSSKGAVYHHSGDRWWNTAWPKQYTPVVGDPIWKSGRTTHDTSGTITNICVDRPHSHYTTVYCQNGANFSADGGDSGGTVYGWNPHYGWQLHGIYWGHDGSTRWFSPIWNIEADQGTLSVR